MNNNRFDNIFTPETLKEIFPENRADWFFETLYGDSSEGAYDIKLVFIKHVDNTLLFDFHLTPRPGKCLACNLTYGLPNVFSRHPVIDVKGIVHQIEMHLNGQAICKDWKIGDTREISKNLHVIPLTVFLG
jgi:hypothetical protein